MGKLKFFYCLIKIQLVVEERLKEGHVE